eukprot:3302114-Rhodomonas_salina.1
MGRGWLLSDIAECQVIGEQDGYPGRRTAKHRHRANRRKPSWATTTVGFHQTRHRKAASQAQRRPPFDGTHACAELRGDNRERRQLLERLGSRKRQGARSEVGGDEERLRGRVEDPACVEDGL